jgi:hypothetical protein
LLELLESSAFFGTVFARIGRNAGNSLHFSLHQGIFPEGVETAQNLVQRSTTNLSHAPGRLMLWIRADDSVRKCALFSETLRRRNRG